MYLPVDRVLPLICWRSCTWPREKMILPEACSLARPAKAPEHERLLPLSKQPGTSWFWGPCPIHNHTHCIVLSCCLYNLKRPGKKVPNVVASRSPQTKSH